MKKPVMIGVSGIRGIIGEGLTPQLLVNFASAVGSFYGPGRVMVGRDSRVSGEMVKAAVFSGLIAVGCTPVDLGICSTPTVQMAVQLTDASGGIVITASHNPANWNALKLLTSEGLFLDEEEGIRVKGIVDEKKYCFVLTSELGNIELYENATEDHIQAILDLPFIDVEKLKTRKFRVAYDCVNGAGGTILPGLLQALGCKTFPLNQEPHGHFAHSPEPVPENLKQLCQIVCQSKADIGFAVDPDVDRLAIVTEMGEPIGEEYSVVLAERFLLSKRKGKVVVNLSTTRAVEDIAKEFNVSVIRTPVGEIHVAKKMKETDAVIGGECNGGVILPDLHLGRDAPAAIALTLQHLLEYDKPISALSRSLPRYHMVKKKVAIGTQDPDTILKHLGDKYKNESLNRLDGLKIDRPDSWVHIRRSNTEPIIRVIAETRTIEKSRLLCDQLLDDIRNYVRPR